MPMNSLDYEIECVLYIKRKQIVINI